MKKLLFIIAIFLLGGNGLFAQSQYDFAGGKGTAEEPYQIKTAEQLDSLRYYKGSANRDNHYSLMNDIDLTEFLQDSIDGWLPIGTSKGYDNNFQGKVHGNGYKIMGLFINRPDFGNEVGLFGQVYNTTIDNLSVEIAEDKSIEGNRNVGGLVGVLGSSSTLSSCSVIGRIVGNGNNVGGLVGNVEGNSSIDFCYTIGNITGKGYVGGLVGDLTNSQISNCYSDAEVISTGEVPGTVGGLVGFNTGGIISKSYATGNVTGSNTPGGIGGLLGVNYGKVYSCYSTGNVKRIYGGSGGAGGLIGHNNANALINSCYSKSSVLLIGGSTTLQAGGLVEDNFGTIQYCYAIGPLAAQDYGDHIFRACGISPFSTNTNIIDCYFNSGTTGVTNGFYSYSAGEYLLSGNTTVEMMQQSTYENWDFDTVWDIKEGESYPFFRWETERKSLLKSITISNGTLSPAFSSGTFDYILNLPADMDMVNLSAVAVAGAKLMGDTGELFLPEDEITFMLKVTAENAPEHTYTITVLRTAVKTDNLLKNENGISLYPNPVKDELIIKGDGVTINRIDIIDMSGKTIKQLNKSTNKIKVSDITKGIYFIRIETEKGFITKKFVKG